MSTLAVLPGIRLDDDGTAWIDGTRIMVSLIACEKNGGWAEAEIQRQHPSITLAQIHAALAYYYDHKTAMDASIAESYQAYRRAWEAQNEDPSHLARERALKERYQAIMDKTA
ncbi:MAG: DUF433 domain-containing protein [Armatimonadetes bacterium]|nr:DUF433 domain-containing protein [Armatimonadota bacterium]